MKRIISMILSFAVILNMSSWQNNVVWANEKEDITINNIVRNEDVSIAEKASTTTASAFRYEIKDNEVTIKGLGDETLTEVSIPDEIEDCPVTSIGQAAFNGTKLEQVVLPNTITNIGSNAFYGCKSLEKVNLPDGICKIKNGTFNGCQSLEEIKIPDSVTHIGKMAFYQCGELKKLQMPCSAYISTGFVERNTKKKYTGLYIYCKNEYNGYYDFYAGSFTGCNKLEEVRLTKGTGKMPEYTSSVDEEATDESHYYQVLPWYGSTLKKITFDDDIENIGSYSFYDQKQLINVNLPQNVKEIGSCSFYGCSSIKEMVLPEGISLIGNSAFRRCSSLESINLSEGISEIADGTFSECSALREIVIPNNVANIGSNAFHGCKSLKKVNLPDGICKIKDGTFNGCQSLEEIKIPDSVTHIGKMAFYQCGELKKLQMPCSAYISTGFVERNTKKKYTGLYIYCKNEYNGYYDFYAGSFTGCNKLEEVRLTKGTGKMPEYTSSVDEEATDESHYYQVLPWYGSTLKKITFDDDIENIGSYSFYDQKQLINVNLPQNVKEIGSCSFYGCSSIKEMVLPEGISLIGNSAFCRCSSLESINLPESISEIADGTFSECSVLEKIVIPNNVTNIGRKAFYECKGLQEIVMPCSVHIATTWETGTSSNMFTDAYSYGGEKTGYYYTYYIGAFSGCDNIQKVILTKGTGKMLDYKPIKDSEDVQNSSYYGILPWSDNPVKTVVLEDGIENIGAYAFCGCQYLKSVEISKTITKIGDYAFSECNGLKKIEIPDSVESIGDKVFYNTDLVVYANHNSVAARYALSNSITCYSTRELSLDKHEGILYKGESTLLTATVFMLNGKVDTETNIEWSSSDTNVVTVINGLVSVIGPGKAIVSATYQGVKDSYDVTVFYKMESIGFTQEMESVPINKTKKLEVQYEPSNTTDDRTIKWKSSDESIATVDGNGIVTGVSKGKATITATSVMGYTASIDISVIVPTTKITIDETLELQKGETKSLMVGVEPSNTTDNFTWKSEDESIVKVDNEGNVKAVAVGKTIVSVMSDSGVKADCVINVKVKSTDIACPFDKITMYEGESRLLEVSMLPEDTTDAILWKCDNEELIAIDQEAGIIKALGTGKTKVTALTDSGLSLDIDITILPVHHITDIIFDDEICVEKGQAKEIPFDVEPEDYTDTLSWNSDDESIATVDNGKISGINNGQCTITVTASGGYQKKFEIKVVTSAKSISLDILNKKVTIGDEFDLTATLLPEDSTDTLEYSSNNMDVVTVTPLGHVVATGIGTCTITVTSSSGKKAECQIEVADKERAQGKYALLKQYIQNNGTLNKNGDPVIADDIQESQYTATAGIAYSEKDACFQLIFTSVDKKGYTSAVAMNIKENGSSETNVRFVDNKTLIAASATMKVEEYMSSQQLKFRQDSTLFVTDAVATELGNKFLNAAFLSWDLLLLKDLLYDVNMGNLGFIKYEEPRTHTWDQGKVEKEASCQQEGIKKYSCIVCGENKEETINITEHKEVKDAAVAATCTKDGKTEGSHCSVCNEVIKPQETIKATGHTEVKDEGVAATCTKDGKTEGSHCSVCNEVIKPQETIKATGHTEVKDEGVAATCTKDGKTEGSHCSVCNEVIKPQETIKATGHTEVKDEGVAATCTKDGKTEGSHCSVCNEVIKPQEAIKALGHNLVKVAAKAATSSEDGNIEYWLCNNCKKYFSDAEGKNEIDPKNTIISKQPNTSGEENVEENKEINSVNKVNYCIRDNVAVCVGVSDDKDGNIIIPNTIEINGKQYKVSSIKDKAFAGNKKIKSVVIGKNITVVGSKAFYKCKNLKKIVIKTVKLNNKTVGSKAFFGIHKKASVKVPKKKAKVYRTWLPKKGIKKKQIK